MLADISRVENIYMVCGYTDMRKSIDGLCAVVENVVKKDPRENALFLFCGRDCRKLKALHYDKDGFTLFQKRLEGSGRFQWPRNASEARLLTRQEYRWLLEGLSIEQPKAIRPVSQKRDF